MSIELIPVAGIPEIKPGDDIGSLILDSFEVVEGDVVVIAQKIVSKAEGRMVEAATREDVRAAAVREARRVVRETPSHLITETMHGFVCANSGVDTSNVPAGKALLLPRRPDESAARIRATLCAAVGGGVAVVISDTFGRPWRLGQTNVAIGSAGIAPFTDHRGTRDSHGNDLRVTQIAVIDEIAGAAELVMGKSIGVPVVIVRGLEYNDSALGASSLVRPASEDLFR